MRGGGYPKRTKQEHSERAFDLIGEKRDWAKYVQSWLLLLDERLEGMRVDFGSNSESRSHKKGTLGKYRQRHKIKCKKQGGKTQ